MSNPDSPIASTSSDFVGNDGIFTDFELISTSDYLHSISTSTKLVEFVGIVHRIESSQTVVCRNGKQSLVLKFFVHNNDDEVVQCNIWGDLIPTFVDKLVVHNFFHLGKSIMLLVKTMSSITKVDKKIASLKTLLCKPLVDGGNDNGKGDDGKCLKKQKMN